MLARWLTLLHLVEALGECQLPGQSCHTHLFPYPSPGSRILREDVLYLLCNFKPYNMRVKYSISPLVGEHAFSLTQNVGSMAHATILFMHNSLVWFSYNNLQVWGLSILIENLSVILTNSNSKFKRILSV